MFVLVLTQEGWLLQDLLFVRVRWLEKFVATLQYICRIM
jgi:hypothetical protein